MHQNIIGCDTVIAVAPVHVELAHRRKAVTHPCRRRRAGGQPGEVCPGLDGRVVDMQVLDIVCASLEAQKSQREESPAKVMEASDL